MQSTEQLAADDVLRLVDSARHGSPAAVDELVAHCLPELTSFARRRRSDDPEGTAGTVMAEFIARLDHLSFTSTSQLWAYLYRSCRNRLIDEARRRKPELPSGLIGRDESEIEIPSSLSPEDVTTQRMEVATLLSGLTAEQRHVLSLRFLEDLSLEEVAQRTGRSLAAIKGLQRRALRAAANSALLLVVVAGIAVAVGRLGDSSQEITNPAVNSTTPQRDGDGSSGTGGEDGQVEERPGAESGTERPPDDRPDPTVTTTVGGSSTVEDPTERPGGSGPAGHATSTSAGQTPSSNRTDPSTPETGPPTSPGPQTTLPSVPPTASRSTPVIHECWSLVGTAEDLEALGYEVTIGTDGDDVIDLQDRAGPQFVVGGAGNDEIRTGGGDDVVCGGDGDDAIFGGAGADLLRGDGGHDVVRGGPGDDRLRGDGGADRLFGDDGNDVVDGNGGADHLRGGRGHDRLTGGPANDLLYGDNGDDTLLAGGGDDVLRGGGGNDRLSGGDGVDELYGDDGDDTLEGDPSVELLVPGPGQDVIVDEGGSVP